MVEREDRNELIHSVEEEIHDFIVTNSNVFKTSIYFGFDEIRSFWVVVVMKEETFHVLIDPFTFFS
jgi:hypothetical protein